MQKNRLENIRQNAFVIQQISYKENKRKTDETNLGMIWNILNPLLYMVILTTYYENVIIHDVENFPLFVFTGITMLYTTGTIGGMHSLVNNKDLITRTRLPVVIFIIQKVVHAFRELCFSSIALIPIMYIGGVRFTVRIFLLIPILILTSAVIIGIGSVLSVVFVYFADIDYLYSVLMTLMFFISGTFIPIERLPSEFQTILAYNPIFISTYLTRNALVYNSPSSLTVWIKLLIWSVVLLGIGVLLLKNQKNELVSRL